MPLLTRKLYLVWLHNISRVNNKRDEERERERVRERCVRYNIITSVHLMKERQAMYFTFTFSPRSLQSDRKPQSQVYALQ